MTKVVLDTNIIVSAALSPKGNPAKIVAYIADNEDIRLYYSLGVLAEYKKVLAYERLCIPAIVQHSIIATTERIGVKVEPIASTEPMPDESDRVFYDTAKACGAILITGNLKHYPNESSIMAPADFINSFAKSFRKC